MIRKELPEKILREGFRELYFIFSIYVKGDSNPNLFFFKFFLSIRKSMKMNQTSAFSRFAVKDMSYLDVDKATF